MSVEETKNIHAGHRTNAAHFFVTGNGVVLQIQGDLYQ